MVSQRHYYFWVRSWIAMVVCLVAMTTVMPQVHGQDFVVNSTGDTGDNKPGDGVCNTGNILPNTTGTIECTLRAAIDEANASPGAHKITLPSGTYNLTSNYPCPASSGGLHRHYCMTGNMSIVGAGASTTILDSARVDRVIFIAASANVQISGVTIQNGLQTGGTYDGGGGGGINSYGNLSIANSVFIGNRSDAFGGGIDSGGPLTVTNSIFINNNGGQEGGGLRQAGSPATIENSTFTGNVATNGGGLSGESSNMNIVGCNISQNIGISEGGGIFGYHSNDGKHNVMNITNTTIVGNSVPNFGGGLAFGNTVSAVLNNDTITGNTANGLYSGSFNGSVTLLNTILAMNPNLNTPDCFGNSLTISGGHNLIGNANGCSLSGANSTDIVGKDPLVGLLADNGGPTQTEALAATSPAINNGSPAIPGTGTGACALTDQRGFDRPQGAACDIGAFESRGGFSVSGALPNHAGNAAPKLVLIYGSGFSANSIPKLICGSTQVVGNGVTLDNAGSVLSTSFDLTGAASGICDVLVSNPNGTSATRSAGFTIENANAPQLWAQIIGRGAIRAGLTTTYRVFYGNRGNTDALAVPLGLFLTSNVASNLQILDVSGPPVQPGDLATNWTGVPIKVHSVIAGDSFVPLLLPVVPAGFTGILEFTVNAPGTVHGQTFSLDANIGAPVLSQGNVVDPAFLQDLTNGAHQYALTVLKTTIPSTADTQLKTYYTNGIQLIVAKGRTALANDLLQASLVYGVAPLMDAGAGFVTNLPIPVNGGSGGGGGGGGNGGGGGGGAGGGGGGDVGPGPGSGGGDDGGDDDCGWIGWCDPDQPPPPPPCDKWPPSACGGGAPGSGPVVDSIDPNDKVGPHGVGTAQYIHGGNPLVYTLYFENQPTATAAAQKVVVTDQLDPTKADLKTLSLGPISFGTQTIAAPTGLTHYTKDVDLRPGQNLIARVVGNLDSATGLLTWTFSSIDPTTLETTQDPLAGFLPPDSTPPAGEASVAFSVNPVATIVTGVTICNQGVVVFDSNPSINTPTWCNTFDFAPPVSHVQALPTLETSSAFTVAWSGTDAGSGISAYNIYASDNGGAFTLWQSQVTSSSAQYTGQTGHTYDFFSQAIDNVGNVEVLKTSADTTTLVGTSTRAPSITLQPLSQTITGGGSVTFTAGASGTPAPTVQWQVSSNSGVTYSNIAGANSPSLMFIGLVAQNGNLYQAVFTNSVNTATTNAAKLTVKPLLGDLNGDGVVNCADIAIVKASFGKKTGQPGFDLRADVNGDSVVNVIDLATVSRQLLAGTTCK